MLWPDKENNERISPILSPHLQMINSVNFHEIGAKLHLMELRTGLWQVAALALGRSCVQLRIWRWKRWKRKRWISTTIPTGQRSRRIRWVFDWNWCLMLPSWYLMATIWMFWGSWTCVLAWGNDTNLEHSAWGTAAQRHSGGGKPSTMESLSGLPVQRIRRKQSNL